MLNKWTLSINRVKKIDKIISFICQIRTRT